MIIQKIKIENKYGFGLLINGNYVTISEKENKSWFQYFIPTFKQRQLKWITNPTTMTYFA